MPPAGRFQQKALPLEAAGHCHLHALSLGPSSAMYTWMHHAIAELVEATQTVNPYKWYTDLSGKGSTDTSHCEGECY